MSQTTFKDHFSGHANLYASARPRYPRELFSWLADVCSHTHHAWDAGCGNGQASVALAEFFDAVYATDASAAQIANAEPHPQVRYVAEAAENCTAKSHSFDLICVAQALHWMDFAAFFQTVERVLKPNGILAIWCYGSATTDDAIGALIDGLENHTLKHYWPPERAYIDRAYADIALPFEPVPTPRFELRVDWSLPQLLAYLRSWSALQRYQKQHADDLILAFEAEILPHWGNPSRLRTICWPLHLFVRRKA